MKRAVILFILALLLLAGCAKKVEIVVNPHAHTISDGSYTYEYTDTIDGDNRTIVITYPNGATFMWKKTGDISTSFDVGPSTYSYTSGSDLVNAIVNPGVQPEEKNFTWLNVGLIVLGGFFVAGGLWKICRPDKVWDTLYKWFYEENASYYSMSQIVASGIGMVISGIGIIIMGFVIYL
jgi:hypothetical protein